MGSFRIAYAFASEAGTVSNPTSQTSPDGLAANAVTREGGSWGKSWVGAAAATTVQIDVTVGSAIAPTVFAVAGCNIAAGATVELYRGPQAGPRTLIATASKCSPANLWVGFPTSGTTGTVFSVKITDATASQIEVPYVVFGTSVTISHLLRPGRGYERVDPSEITRGKTGAKWTLEQRKSTVLSVTINGHDTDSDIAALRTALESVGITRPLLVCLDDADATSHAHTVLGLVRAMPPERLAAGLMTSWGIDVEEMTA